MIIYGKPAIDVDLIPSNIKVGVNILRVVGTFTNDANAVADDITSAKTVYVNGIKITGVLLPTASTILSGTIIAGIAGTAIDGTGMKKYASGTVTGSATTTPAFIKGNGVSDNIARFTITGLTFIPSRIIAYSLNGGRTVYSSILMADTDAYIVNDVTAYKVSGAASIGTTCVLPMANCGGLTVYYFCYE